MVYDPCEPEDSPEAFAPAPGGNQAERDTNLKPISTNIFIRGLSFAKEQHDQHS